MEMADDLLIINHGAYGLLVARKIACVCFQVVVEKMALVYSVVDCMYLISDYKCLDYIMDDENYQDKAQPKSNYVCSKKLRKHAINPN